MIVDDAGIPYLADLGLGRAGSHGRRPRRTRGAVGCARPGRVRRRSAVSWRRAAWPAWRWSRAWRSRVAVGEDGADDAATPRRRSVRLRQRRCPDSPTRRACTLSQDAAPAARAIGCERRAWCAAGRCAAPTGELTPAGAPDPRRALVRAGFSQPVRVRGAGPQAFPANLNVERGDRIGVLLGPGRPDRAPPARGRARPACGTGRRTPLPQRSSAFAGELLLRADVRRRRARGRAARS